MQTSYVLVMVCKLKEALVHLRNRIYRKKLDTNFPTKGAFTRSVFSPFFSPLKWVQQDPMEVFTHDVKKIKGMANKNGLKLRRQNPMKREGEGGDKIPIFKNLLDIPTKHARLIA